MTVPRLTPRRIGEHERFRSRLVAHMRARHLTQTQLGAIVGVSPTMVGYWRQARYLPSIERADMLAEFFGDPMLLEIVRASTVYRCLVCPRMFRRDKNRRKFCSVACRRDYHKGVRGAPSVDERQKAIDAFCRGCEPGGLCRDDQCQLRAFSPLVFVPIHRLSA